MVITILIFFSQSKVNASNSIIGESIATSGFYYDNPMAFSVGDIFIWNSTNKESGNRVFSLKVNNDFSGFKTKELFTSEADYVEISIESPSGELLFTNNTYSVNEFLYPLIVEAENEFYYYFNFEMLQRPHDTYVYYPISLGFGDIVNYQLYYVHNIDGLQIMQMEYNNSRFDRNGVDTIAEGTIHVDMDSGLLYYANRVRYSNESGGFIKVDYENTKLQNYDQITKEYDGELSWRHKNNVRIDFEITNDDSAVFHFGFAIIPIFILPLLRISKKRK